jgi:hypothetical protein
MIDHEGDRQVLKALADHGSDLTKPHHIVYYFYFPSKKAAIAAATRLKQDGFEIQRVGPAPGPWWKRIFGFGKWSCVAETHLVPTEDTMCRTTDRFNAIASELGGEYDGWEAGIVQ